jgi:PAS domain S-box-containing protein
MALSRLFPPASTASLPSAKMAGPSRVVFVVGWILLLIMLGYALGLYVTHVDHWFYLLPGVLLYAISLFINYRGKEMVARNLMFFGTVALFTFLSFANRRLGAEFGLIGLACFAPTIFREKRSVFFAFGLVMSIFIFYLIYDQTQAFTPNPTVNYSLLSKSILIVMLSVVFFQFMLFRNAIAHYSATLKEKNKQLHATLAKKEIAEHELQSKNEELKSLTDQLNWIVIQKTSELQVYLDAINISIYSSIIDEDGKFVKVNEPFSKACGYTPEEMMGKSFSLLEAGFDSESFYQKMKQTLRSGNVWRGETKNKTKDGSYFWSDQVVTPIQTSQGSGNYYLVLGLPITERKKNEEARERTLNFIETVAHQTSHKVRGPLARIQGLVNLIQSGLVQPAEFNMITDKLKESSIEVNQATSDLVNFVNDNRNTVTQNN